MRCISLKTKRIKVLFYVLLAFFLIYVLVLNIKIHRINKKKSKHVNSDIRIPRSEQFNHSEYVELFYMQRKIWETSNLGSVLFKNVNPNNFLKNSKTTKTFTVLVWKYYNWLQNRHIHGFGFSRNDPLDHCEVKNCKFISNDTNISDVDVVLVHLQHGIIPKVKRRNAKQRWVFLTDESPKNVYSLAVNKPKISELSDVFNWSMSYRVESDVPVPYGRTVPLSRPANPEPSAGDIKSLIPNWKTKRRDTLLTILMSNCVSYRMDFLRDLQKYISIDVYGKCSENLKTKCPGHFKSECKSISNYLFYLVIENSICDQYLTEKAFYHAYAKGAIPIIIGPSIEECTTILPPKSFLHIDNFESMQHLANEIKTFAKDEAVLLSYHRWRNDFQVVNEHGYFDTRSYHYCRLCEALNYNDDKKKVYNEEMLRMYLEPKVSCRNISSITFTSYNPN